MVEGSGAFGYNAANGEFGDMIEFGIPDPTKVTRTALQNAASIAGLMITTEAMVAEAPKKDELATGRRRHGRHGRQWDSDPARHVSLNAKPGLCRASFCGASKEASMPAP